MNSLYMWAKRWNIPQEALQELLNFEDHTEQVKTNDKSEAYVQSLIRLEATRHGCRLWRNNVGAGDVLNRKTGELSFIRWGLCNSSKRENERTKSSDSVGIKPVLITQDMVGTTMGQFIAREFKKENWKKGRDSHTEAQGRFIRIVNSLGGDACFVNKEGSFTR